MPASDVALQVHLRHEAGAAELARVHAELRAAADAGQYGGDRRGGGEFVRREVGGLEGSEEALVVFVVLLEADDLLVALRQLRLAPVHLRPHLHYQPVPPLGLLDEVVLRVDEILDGELHEAHEVEDLRVGGECEVVLGDVGVRDGVDVLLQRVHVHVLDDGRQADGRQLGPVQLAGAAAEEEGGGVGVGGGWWVVVGGGGGGEVFGRREERHGCCDVSVRRAQWCG